MSEKTYTLKIDTACLQKVRNYKPFYFTDGVNKTTPNYTYTQAQLILQAMTDLGIEVLDTTNHI